MAAEKGIDQFLKGARSKPRAEGGESHRRVEGIFEELELPFDHEAGGWWIDTDVGRVRAGLDESGHVLTMWQPIHQLTGGPKKNADYLATLLRINSGTVGACFCLDEYLEGEEWVLLMSRISAQQIDKEEVELALEGLLRMSALYDEAEQAE